MTKYLFFGCLLFAGCNHSADGSAPSNATVVIPSATTTSPKTNDPPTPPPAVDSACEVPADFPVAEALPKGADQTEILAWRSRVDERPLYVEDALIWQKRTDGGKAVYTLAHVYRHPKDENKFRLSVIYDAPVSAEATFDHPPNGKDVESYLGHGTLEWQSGGFKTIASKVCASTWTRLIGEAPKHDFVK